MNKLLQLDASIFRLFTALKLDRSDFVLFIWKEFRRGHYN